MTQSITRILLIDDDPGMFALVQGLVNTKKISLHWAKSLAAGVQTSEEVRPDLIVLDHMLPDGQGIERIDELLHQDRLRPILYVTAQSGSNTAIEAIKRGAFDYLSKPIDFNQLRQRMAEAIEYRQLTRLPVIINPTTSEFSERDVLVGRCRAMQNVYKGIGRLAVLSAPVLIEGEAGTGKEMIARAIHQHGTNQAKPFVKVGPDELCDDVFWDYLFGKSSMKSTGQSSPLADWIDGTLMIEEIAGVPLAAQSKLLRFLQDPTLEESRLSLRVIITTSQASQALMERGELRSDLFYYLSPYVIRVPPLRERQDDLEMLVAHFMQRLANITALDKHEVPPRVSVTALHMLKSYDWPGNVAQLKSVLQSVLMESRGAVLATDALSRALSDRGMDNKYSSATSSEMLKSFDHMDVAGFVKSQIGKKSTNLYEEAIVAFDQKLLTLVLQHTKGNQAAAARILGITRTSLRRKILASKIQLSTFAEPNADDLLEEQDGSAAQEAENT